MRNWKKLARISLIAVCVLVAMAFLLPNTSTALDGGTWELTQEAQDRTATGECGATGVCLEWCMSGTPTGDFMCFWN